MKSLFDRLSDIKKQIFVDDHQIVCNYYMGIKDSLLDLLEDANRQIVIVDEKLQGYGCARYEPGGELRDREEDVAEPESGERYDVRASWAQKVEYVLRKYNKPMNFTEITDAIVSHEIKLGMDKKEKQELRNTVRTSLGDTMKKNSVNRARTPARFKLLAKVNKGDINTYWLAGEDLPEGK